MKQMHVVSRDKSDAALTRGGRKLIFTVSKETERMIGTIRALATPRIIPAADAIRLAIRVMAMRLRDEEIAADDRRIAEMDAAHFERMAKLAQHDAEPIDDGQGEPEAAEAPTPAAPAPALAPWDDPSVSPADLADLPDDGEPAVSNDPGL